MRILEKFIAAVSPKWAFNRSVDAARASFMADDAGAGNYYGPYQGAMSTRTSTPWFISPTNPAFRYASEVALRSMRNRSRTIQKNNEIAEGLLSRTVENVVGPKGFQLQVTSNNPAWTEEKNAEWSTKAQSLMQGWFPNADITGLGWIEHQRAVLRAALGDGDVGVNLDSDGYLQGIEGDLIANPNDSSQTAGKTILFGVETDPFNKPLAYWVNTLPSGAKDSKSIRIDAKNFILVANRTRFGQLRGITVYSTIFDLLDQISSWKQATLMAARIAACFGVAITKDDTTNLYNNNTGNKNSAGQNQTQINLEPGAIQYLKKGETVTTINPANPGHNFPENLVALVRLAGLPFGMPLELVLLDFSKTSYAASRAAMLQAYRKFQAWQQWFIDSYLKRVYQWRISKFIKAGLLEDNADAWNHKWIAQPWPFLDPIKENQGIQMSLDSNLTTLRDILQAHGTDLDRHIQQRSIEIKKLTAAGIPMLHSQALMQFVNPTTAMQPVPKPASLVDGDDDDDELEDEDD